MSPEPLPGAAQFGKTACHYQRGFRQQRAIDDENIMSLPEGKFHSARIIERKNVTDDLWSIRVNPGGEFTFRPGQYATLGIVTRDNHVERAYSIASAPHEQGLEFFVEHVPQGELTPLLYELQKGDALTLRKVAKGRFTLDTQSGRTNHLLLATVTGVAPFVSYARSMYKEWKDGRHTGVHKLYLIQGASNSAEFGYCEELRAYASEVPWLEYVPTVSRPWDDAAWAGERGRVDDLIRKYTDLWSLTPDNTSVYLCGHPSMVENGKGILHRSGWEKTAMKEEIYFIPAKQLS
jgi:ferredoxin--NADP+ reductase